MNDWVENQIAEVQNRRKVTGDDPVEKELLTLFRYLTILARCINPYSTEKSISLQEDLQAYLELCICRTVGRLVDGPVKTGTAEIDDL